MVLHVGGELFAIDHAVAVRVHLVEAALSAIGVLTVVVIIMATLHAFVAVIIVILAMTTPLVGMAHPVFGIGHLHARAVSGILAGHLAASHGRTGGEQGKDSGGCEKGFHDASPVCVCAFNIRDI